MSYSIRLATLDDELILYEWRNEPKARANSFNLNQIDYGKHKKWFRDKLASNDSYIFILIDEINNQKCGQIRFDLKNFTAKISYSINQSYRGKSLGKLIIKLGMEHAKQYFLVNKFIAYVKYSNIASIKTFEQLSYSKTLIEDYYEFTYSTKKN